MTTQTPSLTLAEAIFPQTGLALRVKQLVLVVAGITALILAAKIKIPMFPVPMTMGTFAVLSIGAAYGARLGLATILGYMLIGALGFDVFAGSSAEVSGVTYMMGGTGGYLVGYVLAVLALGALARQGWDRARGKMALALVLGNVLIYRAWFDLVDRALRRGCADFSLGLNAVLVGRFGEIGARRTLIACALVPGGRRAQVMHFGVQLCKGAASAAPFFLWPCAFG